MSEPTTREPGGRSDRPKLPFVAQILLGMGLGVGVGLLLGPRAGRLGEIGVVVIDLIKGLAGPLLFLAVLDAFLRTDVKIRDASLMVSISLLNGVIAIAIGLGLANALQPGRHAASLVAGSSWSATRTMAGTSPSGLPATVRKLDFVREFTGYIPRNILQPFLENSVISIVILAVLIGLAMRSLRNESGADQEGDFRLIERLIATAIRTISTLLGGVIRFLPLAVFGVVARTVGRDGLAPLGALGWYLGVIVLGLSIQVFGVYQAWVVFGARRRLGWFWQGARDAVVYSLGASSSLATLPVTLDCLDRMKVSRSSSRLAACVGTNLNNDGILLYEASAVLFVAQAYGIDLTIGQQLLAAGACVIAGVGIAGIPEAGLISLTLVLTTVGLPIEIVPVLLTVDWLLSRCRAATNVTSDILVAVLLDRLASHPHEDLPDPTRGEAGS